MLRNTSKRHDNFAPIDFFPRTIFILLYDNKNVIIVIMYVVYQFAFDIKTPYVEPFSVNKINMIIAG